MEAAEGWARERGAGLMMLDASVANLDALRFYEQCHGYRRKRHPDEEADRPGGLMGEVPGEDRVNSRAARG